MKHSANFSLDGRGSFGSRLRTFLTGSGLKRQAGGLPVLALESFQRHLRELQWALPLPAQKILFRDLAPRYNPYTEWNTRFRAVFIHVPRTGGTSIAMAAGAPKRHIPIARYQLFDAGHYDEYLKFAFVRNPWDRLLSAYWHIRSVTRDSSTYERAQWTPTRLTRFDSFESFVLALERPRFRKRLFWYAHFRPQLDWIALPRSTAVPLDFIGRFESLQEDFAELAEKLGLAQTLSFENDSHHEPYREAYSRRMHDVVADIYAADIAALGYSY